MGMVAVARDTGEVEPDDAVGVDLLDGADHLCSELVDVYLGELPVGVRQEYHVVQPERRRSELVCA